MKIDIIASKYEDDIKKIIKLIENFRRSKDIIKLNNKFTHTDILIGVNSSFNQKYNFYFNIDDYLEDDKNKLTDENEIPVNNNENNDFDNLNNNYIQNENLNDDDISNNINFKNENGESDTRMIQNTDKKIDINQEINNLYKFLLKNQKKKESLNILKETEPKIINCKYNEFSEKLKDLLISILGYSFYELQKIQYRNPNNEKIKENVKIYLQTTFYFSKSKILVLNKSESFKSDSFKISGFLDYFYYPYTQVLTYHEALNNLLDSYFLVFNEVKVDENNIILEEYNDIKNINKDFNIENSEFYLKKEINDSEQDKYVLCKFFNTILIFKISKNLSFINLFEIKKHRFLIDKIGDEIIIPFIYNDYDFAISSYFNNLIEKYPIEKIKKILEFLPKYSDHRKIFLKSLQKNIVNLLEEIICNYNFMMRINQKVKIKENRYLLYFNLVCELIYNKSFISYKKYY